MSISYAKLLKILEERGITSYTFRKNGIISQNAWTKIHSGNGNIDMRTLDSLCEFLQCQPGDLLEHVPDSE